MATTGSTASKLVLGEKYCLYWKELCAREFSICGAVTLLRKTLECSLIMFIKI